MIGTIVNFYDQLGKNGKLFVAGRHIKGIAFDLEGTLVDLEEQHHIAHQVAIEILLKLHIDPYDTATAIELLPNFIGGPDKKIMEQAVDLSTRLHSKLMSNPQSFTSSQTPNSSKVIDELLGLDNSIFTQLRDGADTLEPRNGVIDFLQELNARSIPIAIGSLTSERDANVLLKKSGLQDYFDPTRIILKEHVRALKPDPSVYLKTAEQMHIDPFFQLVFEDSHNGIIAARRAGSVGLGVPTTTDEEIRKRLLREGAAFVSHDWTELTRGNTMNIEGSNLVQLDRPWRYSKEY